MPKHWLLLLIISLFTVPLAAQDEYTPYIIALQRIEEAQAHAAATLNLANLGLSAVQPEIGQLTHLQSLLLNENRLSTLPPEIGQLTQLQNLWAYNNQLTRLPPEIGQLANLSKFVLNDNQLSDLPSEINQLRNLCYLDISQNHFRHLPVELGDILAPSATCPEPQLVVSGNPLITPPPEVIAQGTPAILEYLRNQAWYHTQRLITGAASGVGLLAGVILLARWRYRRLRKPKKKHGE